MFYSNTMDEQLSHIEGQDGQTEMHDGIVDMSGFFDQVERNNTLRIAKAMYDEKRDSELAICVIEAGLHISREEAKKIFETEILVQYS